MTRFLNTLSRAALLTFSLALVACDGGESAAPVTPAVPVAPAPVVKPVESSPTTTTPETTPATTPTTSPATTQPVSAGEYPLTVCLVSGEKLGEMGKPVVLVYEGREVKFCCDECVKDFKADPAKFIAKLDAAAAKDAPVTN